MSESQIKTPLDFALDDFATPDARQLVLKTLHAVIVSCMTQAAVDEEPKDPVARAAQFTCYGKMVKAVEVHLPKHSSLPLPARRTVYTAPLPQANGQ